MSIKTTVTAICDHCGRSVDGNAALAWPVIAFHSGIEAQDTPEAHAHVCTGCVGQLAEFFPKINREVFGRFVSHASSFEMFDFESTRVLPKTTMQMTERPAQHGFFRPERVVIEHPSDWLVNDITVGNRSQFCQPGDVPGDFFAENATDTEISFETIQPGQDFSIIATYIGKNPEGRTFRCKVHGKRQGFAPADGGAR
jgi:hypothetical protein